MPRREYEYSTAGIKSQRLAEEGGKGELKGRGRVEPLLADAAALRL